MPLSFIQPDWPAPANVHALSTTRLGGLSSGPFAGLNLGDHVGDDPVRVEENRALLQRDAAIPGTLPWLRQVHGITVHPAATPSVTAPEADAACAHAPGHPCVVMTADCLPVLFCDRAGTVIAAAHAGWRGLHAGVLEASVTAMGCDPAEVLAWLGPAIGPDAFEVGSEVRTAFIAEQAEASEAFKPSANADKWLANLYQLARLRLRRAGVSAIYGGEFCTVSDATRFYSYRRDGQTGRMASLIWLA
ncbi:peptidoglycan editing factor PgeF [Aeromonas simiae]|uniref:peptidoglycan editing factor PgeF n=1 Tax=Aeromonas simiae TaxID=218936 RepID=UPI0005A8D873|nr:peptidoglycan editing factor PgeF [Aeromonas simiae]MDO2948308.1 peptidoglycan editing factor PgeF [Aeromonas simiae]MDO2952955.1 peptidoglycan editing factor PgeF [Aeromonas simiae]MDO2955691.1 peptidoglycan editing factor PgeF [Aeromonas simiae]